MKIQKRTLLIGGIWSLIFWGWWLPMFFFINWRFNMYAPSHWRFLLNEFEAGWQLDSIGNWIFVFSLLLSIPLWLFIWRLCLKVQWKKLYQKIRAKILILLNGGKQNTAPKKAKFKPKQSYKKVRPAPLNTTKRVLSAASQQGAKEVKSITTPARATVPQNAPSFLTQEELNTPLSDISIPKAEPLKEDIQRILLSGGYQLLKDIYLGDLECDYLALDGEKILLCFSDNEKGDWLADEELFNGEPPLWFSETAHRVSPVFKITEAVEKFKKKLSKNGLDQTVVPILIEKAGTIINADEMASVWKSAGILVCRTDLGGPEELMSFTQTLPEATGSGDVGTLSTIQSIL